MPRQTFFNLPEDKRKLVTNLAVEEFAAKAYHQASLSRIVDRAGIAKGSLYQYFEDKFDLYSYILQIAADTKLKALREAIEHLDPDADLFRRLTVATRASLTLAKDYPELFAVGLNILRETDENLLARILARLRPAGDNVLQDWFAEAMERGQLDRRVSPMTAVYLFNAVTWQMGQDVSAGRMTFEQVEPFMAGFIDILKNGMAPCRQGQDG